MVNRKMIVGIGLLVSIAAIAFFAAPIQAYFGGADHGDLLQTQEQERLRTRECDCNGECTQTQCAYRQRVNECATNGICNCTRNMREYRHQNREKTGLPD
jgi:hypothetical protein